MTSRSFLPRQAAGYSAMVLDSSSRELCTSIRRFFCWGCYHFSHWVIQKALPLLSTSLIEAKGIVFWSHLLADNVFNIWTFVFLARHLSHRASFAEGAVGSTSDNVPPGPEYRGCGLMKKLPLPCKKRGFQAVLIIFGAVSVWTLLNED